MGGEIKARILESILIKGKSRTLSPRREDLRDQEIRERAEADYKSLAAEIEGDLPAFDESYELVTNFYESLPWK
ncbi:hypothetical protein D3C83_189610 [compost metagenome]